MKTVTHYLLSLLLLLSALYIGKSLSLLLPFVPESIWGLLVLLTSLISGIVKIHWILPSSRLITRYMPLFFLPICVGIIDYADLLAQHFASLVAANLLSSTLSLLFIGWLAQWLFQRRHAKKEATH